MDLYETKITEREHEVFQLVCKGFTNQEIAEKLFVSIHTVKAHLTAVLRKLNIKNRTLLAYFAGKFHLFEVKDENLFSDVRFENLRE